MGQANPWTPSGGHQEPLADPRRRPIERGGLGLRLVQGSDPLGPHAGPSGGTPRPLCGVGVPIGMAGVAGDTEVGGVSWPLSGVHGGLPGGSSWG